MMSNKGYLDMELLRFTTAGSVDDGKSTLIGRLLYDSKAIFKDQMEAIERASVNQGEDGVNLALLTDGLRAEREQGITIDVAYRYFATPRRKFIIADTPGHIQYTRNMVTGASSANAACILIDARNGVIEQTKRHAFIASLLNIPHILVCINKMDLVDYDEAVYNKIKLDFASVSEKLKLRHIYFIPMSAKLGDNVVDRSMHMPWYKGETFLTTLETVPLFTEQNLEDARFPVQYVIRPHKEEFHDYRGYAGSVVSGVFCKGDRVTILPSGIETCIDKIMTYKKEEEKAVQSQAVTLTLTEKIDVSRGDMIVKSDNLPEVSSELHLMICWLNETPLQVRGKYLLQHTTNHVKCVITEVEYKMNINTLEKITDDKQLVLNDIASIRIKTAKPLFFDAYRKNRATGSLILVNEATNETVAAGMIL